ncbi:hypothetical protein HPULCUR_008543 [Helicostylum pulchrum]|uniref:Uncharacterized protein n=1 Tax=Helicostylum pulchrum TaxID=562976 RepID=A0ABP9Y7X1_9FUNG
MVALSTINQSSSTFITRAIRYCLNVFDETKSLPVLAVISVEGFSSKQFRDTTFDKSDNDLFFTHSCQSWAKRAQFYNTDSIAERTDVSPIDPMIALCYFFMLQERGILALDKYDDPTIQRFVEYQWSQFTKIIKCNQDQSEFSNKRLRQYAEDGARFAEQFKRQHLSTETESVIPIASENDDEPTADLLFVDKMRVQSTGRFRWMACYSEGTEHFSVNMSVDNLSISFASSMGIENIQDEYLNKNNLYTDLDQLERSVEAEFEQYMNQARSFPFQEEQYLTREHPELEDASVHSDYEILGADLLDQVNDELALDNDSWQRYLENNDVDDNYNVKPLRNNTNISFRREESKGYTENQHYSGITSPGQYFGARSLPLSSMDNLWQHKEDREEEDEQDDEKEENQEYEEESLSFSSSIKEQTVTATDKLLEARFKTLPKTLRLFPKYELPEIELHHPYTQKKSNGSISSTRQQCASRPKTNSTLSSFSNSAQHQEQDICTVEPTSLHFLCEMSPKTIYAKVIYLKITNTSPDHVRSFSIYSSKNLLEFETSQGMILEHEVVQVKVKVQSSALLSYRRQQASLDEYPSIYDRVLVLIDHQHVTELDANIDFMSLDDDDDDVDDNSNNNEPKECDRPKCPYCALEKGYPLHSL